MKLLYESTCKYVIGIDEVGRGPLAGPVTLCAAMVETKRISELFSEGLEHVRDSKKMKPKDRERLCKLAKQKSKAGIFSYSVSHVSSSVIDSQGLAPAIRTAVARCLHKIEAHPSECSVLLDGSLYAPQKFINQETIIKGDDKEPIISLASVIAKVTRDNLMRKWGKRYPGYGFEIHKGYGTRFHRSMILKHGTSPLHRMSFLNSIIPKGRPLTKVD